MASTSLKQFIFYNLYLFIYPEFLGICAQLLHSVLREVAVPGPRHPKLQKLLAGDIHHYLNFSFYVVSSSASAFVVSEYRTEPAVILQEGLGSQLPLHFKTPA